MPSSRLKSNLTAILERVGETIDPNTNPLGQRGLLTPAVHTSIIEEIDKGASLHGAAALAGVSHPGSAYRWYTWGKRQSLLPPELQDPTNPYLLFYFDVCQARLRLSARNAQKWIHMATTPQRKIRRTYKQRLVTDSTGAPTLNEDGTPQVIRYLEKEIEEEIGEGDIQAIAEFQSRQFPDETDDIPRGWRKTTATEITGRDGEPIAVNHTLALSPNDIEGMSLEAKRELLAIFESKSKQRAELEARTIDVQSQSLSFPTLSSPSLSSMSLLDNRRAVPIPIASIPEPD